MTDQTHRSDDAAHDYDELYEQRNEAIRHTIDVLAAHSKHELSEFGAKTEIATEYDLDPQRIHYVLDKWADLVNWRRNADANPLDSEAVRAAYDDDTLRAMAGGVGATFTCPDCGDEFDAQAQLRGHLAGECETPENWTMANARSPESESQPAIVSDGASQVTVDIELALDEVFRMVKLLPGDLGLNIYAQTLEADLPHEQIRRILQAADE